MAQLFLHFVGTAIAREQGLGNSRQESPVDNWLPSVAPAGTTSLGKITLDNETEVFHKVVDISTKVGGFFRLHLGADIFFKGTVEVFSQP